MSAGQYIQWHDLFVVVDDGAIPVERYDGIESGIPNADQAVSFFQHHGVLDIEHVREGDRNLMRLGADAARQQVLEGAYFTSGIYRSLVRALLPS